MASTFKWVAPEAIASALTTELNSLADSTFATASAAIDNETDLYQYMELELNLASLSPTAGAFVEIYLLPTLDGTNYADSGKLLQTTSLLTVFQLDTTASTAQRMVSRIVPIPPLKFKLVARNRANVSLAASGNTLKYRRFNDQAV